MNSNNRLNEAKYQEIEFNHIGQNFKSWPNLFGSTKELYKFYKDCPSQPMTEDDLKLVSDILTDFKWLDWDNSSRIFGHIYVSQHLDDLNDSVFFFKRVSNEPFIVWLIDINKRADDYFSVTLSVNNNGKPAFYNLESHWICDEIEGFVECLEYIQSFAGDNV